MTDDSLTPTDSRNAPPQAVASDSGTVGSSPGTAEPPGIGELRQEGTPALGSIALDGHTSGIGAVMLQRLIVGPGDKPIGSAALAVAANDNPAWVGDLSDAGAIDYVPAVAELTTGDTFVAWIGADGHAHGHLYPPAHATGAADGARYAGINAALDDLGPVGEALDGNRRLQVAELRPGTFAVMWFALAQGSPALQGSLLVGSPESDYGHGWSKYTLPDVHLPPGFRGPFSIGFVEHEAQGRLEVTCSDPVGTIASAVLDRSAGATIQAAAQAATSGLGALAVDGTRKTAGAPLALDENAADLDALPEATRTSSAHNAGGTAETVVAVAATPGVDETEPLVEAVHGGFAVAWQTPGATDQGRQIKLQLYDAHGAPRGPEILVADNAAAGAEAAEISALEDGVVVAYVDAGDGDLVVKAYAGNGAQIGSDAVVARGDSGVIVETALATNTADELAVVYTRQHGDAGDGAADYGNIMLQRYVVTTVDGVDRLLELGSDGPSQAAVPPATAADSAEASSLELAAGRAPTAIGVDDGFAIAWVESDGTRETVKGVVLDRHGAEVQRIDLSHLRGPVQIAEGVEPTLLDVVDGFLVSWLQPDAEGGHTVMAAFYREAAPGVWLAPTGAASLKAFSEEPDDYEVSVSSGTEGLVINVIWDEGSSGPGGRKAVYSQRYDVDGRQLGDATKIALDDTGHGGRHTKGDSLAAAGLADGQVVVLARQGSGGDQDLFAHVIPASAVGADAGVNPGTTDTGTTDTGAFTTGVGEATAIDPLAGTPGSGLTISHINGVPITTASPVDVAFGWVQLRDDGLLTVTPDAGYRGRIAFDYSAAGELHGQDTTGHVVIDVGADMAPAAVTLLNQVIAVAEDVSTASALKVADIAMAEGELGIDGLSLTGLDAGMFEIVDNALYLKQGIELDFDAKPSLSVEILATHAEGFDGGASFTLNVAGAGAAALAAANDMLLFAPGYGETIVNHPLIDLSSIQNGIVQELVDVGALAREGDNVVITLSLDDHADLQKIVLKGAALAAPDDAEFKFS